MNLFFIESIELLEIKESFGTKRISIIGILSWTFPTNGLLVVRCLPCLPAGKPISKTGELQRTFSPDLYVLQRPSVILRRVGIRRFTDAKTVILRIVKILRSVYLSFPGTNRNVSSMHKAGGTCCLRRSMPKIRPKSRR